MKKFTFLLTVLVVISIETNAQIPNSGFENWENYTDSYTGHIYEKPDLWNGSLPNNSAYSFSIQKISESYPAGTGQYCIKIQPDIPNGVRGVAISNDGADPMTNWIPKPSFAINYRPSSLYLYYKCFPFGGDTIIGQVYFYKNGVVIGNTVFGTTQTVSNWTPWEVPITYFTTDIPDSATIFFVTGAYIQHSESTLYIDNLSFESFINSVPEQTTKNNLLEILPNPSNDFITLKINKQKDEDMRFNIFTIKGELVKSGKLKQDNQQIYIGDLSDGTYIVEIQSQKFTEKQKLIIKSI